MDADRGGLENRAVSGALELQTEAFPAPVDAHGGDPEALGALRDEMRWGEVSEDDKNETPDVASSGPIWHHASSIKGMRRSMEDRFDVLAPAIDESTLSFFAVFDGHAGGECADFLSKMLIDACSNDTESLLEDPEAFLKSRFLDLDDRFCDYAASTDHHDGSTAVLAVVEREPTTSTPMNLWVANTGDSRALVVRKSGTVKELSREHSPQDEEERMRIEDEGGFVKYVVNPFSAAGDGTLRVNGVLAMTRAFGNYSMKPFVTAEPDVARRKIRKDDAYICLASDGLNETVTDEEIGQYLLQFGAHKGAEKLSTLALERGSTDNITVLAAQLNPSLF
ncbi:Protein phosphatase 1F [Hondaea fermentalgiana]|uniref:Protein phosphatase 1F n=1 Tax=Hondaea fermentalgiana TaxID=2315210 RepID=A0A2R5GUT3_9STRA|nr:Protein phosphatase 1F [Hondaea fermentalgiana]|eukprot:GBG32141.1 Protein phosphatase 1F [Hondaea fermentalgiana]